MDEKTLIKLPEAWNNSERSAANSHVQAFAAHCQCRYVYLDVPRSVIIDCDAVECFRQNPWEHDQCIKDQSDRVFEFKFSPKITPGVHCNSPHCTENHSQS